MSKEAVDFFHKVIKYPLMTEKAVSELELRGKVHFIVDDDANKKMVKEAVERYFNVKVRKVNILNTPDGIKKAIVTLQTVDDARKIAITLGIL